ncbi:hypothetical protein FRY98_16030 [Paenibacillus faecis]|uniref:DUF4367 domain-containing protein n=1 Tax=Paenibacillus faecis TaxID=862114 RepID=A0A5D0CQH9_9BACL|nr:hypothetical protein [Paenibacillus faecis]TYA12219.1 hypothetical protein FRY98_16030 [Paenibacillus faecis]
MNIKRYSITLISVLLLTAVFGTALASPDINTNQDTITEGQAITTAAEIVDLENAEILMDNIDLHLPTVLPDNFQQESVIYNEPPAIINNSLRNLNEDSVKEVTIRYRDQSDATKWIDYTTKEMEIELIDENVQQIEINGVQGQFLESKEKGIKVYNWFSNGASHFVIAKDGIDESQILSFINSIK